MGMSQCKRNRRFLYAVLLLALVSVAPGARAVEERSAGPAGDGMVRLVRYVACAVGAFTSVIRNDGAVITQSLLFCAQLLQEESH
jgi:hypothetical protein